MTLVVTADEKVKLATSNTATMTNPALIAAADWWVIAFSNPQFNNGSDAQGGTPFAGMLARLAAVGISEETAHKFRVAIYDLLQKKIDNGSTRINVDVDYHPDILLHTAIAATGYESMAHNAPWKTSMYIDVNKSEVYVSHGYGAPLEWVFPYDKEGTKVRG